MRLTAGRHRGTVPCMATRVPDIPVRLELSARVIDGWEKLGKPMGHPEDLIRMIDQEGRELAYLLKHDDGTMAEPIKALQARYKILASKVRISGH